MASDVHNGIVNIKSCKFITSERAKRLDKGFTKNGDVLLTHKATIGESAILQGLETEYAVLTPQVTYYRIQDEERLSREYLYAFFNSVKFQNDLRTKAMQSTRPYIGISAQQDLDIVLPRKLMEQKKIGVYFFNLDHLITLHQRKQKCLKKVPMYIKTTIIAPTKEITMAELESMIEQKLIEQLAYGDSQWTYRDDLKTEDDLWKNFRYILEQNNKERLNGENLSDAEFEQVKNQLQFSSFYKAGEWLVGENGKVMVHVQRNTEKLHLVVMNHEHIAGGSSVYEVINQYRALADDDTTTKVQDRRFDVTLMINGLPMIHIELKNKQHSYMDGF